MVTNAQANRVEADQLQTDLEIEFFLTQQHFSTFPWEGKCPLAHACGARAISSNQELLRKSKPRQGSSCNHSNRSPTKYAVLANHTRHPSKKNIRIHLQLFELSCRQTERQTDRHWVQHVLLGGGNYVLAAWHGYKVISARVPTVEKRYLAESCLLSLLWLAFNKLHLAVQ